MYRKQQAGALVLMLVRGLRKKNIVNTWGFKTLFKGLSSEGAHFFPTS
jgi:hypothetical protein